MLDSARNVSEQDLYYCKMGIYLPANISDSKCAYFGSIHVLHLSVILSLLLKEVYLSQTRYSCSCWVSFARFSMEPKEKEDKTNMCNCTYVTSH